MVRGEALAVVPREEFLWCKLYILQRDHCDWTDVFNLLYAVGPQLDWEHLLTRLEEDWPLLKGVLTVYGWLCPKQAKRLPESLPKEIEAARAEKFCPEPNAILFVCWIRADGSPRFCRRINHWKYERLSNRKS